MKPYREFDILRSAWVGPNSGNTPVDAPSEEPKQTPKRKVKKRCPTPYPGGTCGCGCDCETDEKAFHDMHHRPFYPEPYCRHCQPNKLSERARPAKEG